MAANQNVTQLGAASAPIPLTALIYLALSPFGTTNDAKCTIANLIATILQNVNGFTAQQYFAETALTDGTSISWNLNTNQCSHVTLGGNRTLSNPTNMQAGATYILRVIQDGTGSRLLSYGTAYKWPSGVAPTLSTAAGAIDILTFYCDGTNMNGVANLNFS